MFDKIHRRLVEQNRKRRSRGENIQDIKLAQSYIDTVEQRAKDQDPFSRLIVNACTSYATDGITREAYKWEKYVAALKNKIEAEQSSGQVNLDGQKARVSEKIASLRGGKESWEDFIDTYKEMEKDEILLPVIEASCKYKYPSRYDDLLRITTRLVLLKNVKLGFHYEIFNMGKGTISVTGETVHAFVNKKGRPIVLRKKNPFYWRILKEKMYFPVP